MWSLFKPKQNVAPAWYQERVEELRHNRIAIMERQRLDKAELRDRLPKLRNIGHESEHPAEAGHSAVPPQFHATVPRPAQSRVDARREWEVSNTHQAWKSLIEQNMIGTRAEHTPTYNSLKKVHFDTGRAQQLAELSTQEQLGHALGTNFSQAAGIKAGVSRGAPVVMRQASDFEKQKTALLRREIDLRQNDAPEALSFVTALLQIASGIYSKADLPDSLRATTPLEEDLHAADAAQIFHLARKSFPNAEDEHARRTFMVEQVNLKYNQSLAVTVLSAPKSKSGKYVFDDQLTPADCQKGVALLRDGARFHVMTGFKPIANPKLTRDLYLKQKTGFGRFESFITNYLPSQRGAARRRAQATSNQVLAQKFADGVKPLETDIDASEAYKEWDKRTNPHRMTKNLQPAEKIAINNKFLFIDPEVLQSLYLANMQETTPTLHPDKCQQLAEAFEFRRLIKSEINPERGTTYDDLKIFFDKLHADERISDALHNDLCAINESTQSVQWKHDAIDAFAPSNWLPPLPKPDELATSDELTNITDAFKLLEEELSASEMTLQPEDREKRKEQFHSLKAEYVRGIREGDLGRIRAAAGQLQDCTSREDRQEDGASSTTPATGASRLAHHLKTIIRRGEQTAATDLTSLSSALTNLGLAKGDVDAVMCFNLEALQEQQHILKSTLLSPHTVRKTLLRIPASVTSHSGLS